MQTRPLEFWGTSFTGRNRNGRPRQGTVCGILTHSSLVIKTEGLSLGLAAIRFWTRNKVRGKNAPQRKVNPTRVPIEEREIFR
jgi:hypothetical protein